MFNVSWDFQGGYFVSDIPTVAVVGEPERKPKRQRNPKLKAMYNTTQLHVEQDFANHVFHRDRFAHYLRWTYAMRGIRVGASRILDVGCGDANLLKVLYANRRAPKAYLGLDVREGQVRKLREAWSGREFAFFETFDGVVEEAPKYRDFLNSNGLMDTSQIEGMPDWEYVTCFEVLEHVGKPNVPALIRNIRAACGPETVALFSTPVFDEKVGAANNHVIGGQVGELTADECRQALQAEFEILETFGTFASRADIEPVLSASELDVFRGLLRWFDPNLMSVIFAPLHPEASRNVLWRCRTRR